MRLRFTKNKIGRIAAALCALAVTGSLTLQSVQAEGDLPYDTYNYDYWENIVYTPAAYVPNGSISGLDVGTTAFSSPQDLCLDGDGNIYVADTKNNRIVVLDPGMTKTIRIIDTFVRDGEEDTFDAPYGVCVSENGLLYVADSNNKRILIMTPEGEYLRMIETPVSEILEDDFDFVPLKVAVDYADRVYCIVKNAFEGILVFEADGSFTGYFGTIEVKISAWEKFWKRIATKEERSKQQLYIPTEFTGIDIDTEGFVYASNIDTDGEQGVRRLNPSGDDVIQKGENSNLGGDLTTGTYGDYSGYSEFTDVVYRGKGIYSCLDRKRGRIFTYDKEGNLLYIFGGIGTQAGTFRTPVAIESTDTEILVLDAYRNSIMRFTATEYGTLINDAVGLRYDGDETLAIEKWEKVLLLDENNELANTGVGKAYLTAGDNETAMYYLKLAMNRKYYSIAYRRYRNAILTENMNVIMTVLIAVIVALIVYFNVFHKKVKAARAARKARKEALR